MARGPNTYFPPGTTLKEACFAAVTIIINTYNLRHVALLVRIDGAFVTCCATGVFSAEAAHIPLIVKDMQLIEMARRKQSLTLRDWWNAAQSEGAVVTDEVDNLKLFPLIVGDEVKGVLMVDDDDWNDEKQHELFKFSTEVALPLEVLRLRQELDQCRHVATHLQAFTEHVNAAQPDDPYHAILHHSAELLHAERGSLMLFDEVANELKVKAATGPRAGIAATERIALGESISGQVLREGRPLVVGNLAVAGHHPSPPERRYKTNSFISFPIIAGSRKVGVLNVTDKADGGVYSEWDLRMLEMIAPQVALALDRAEWHRKATQFQLLSITDALTGLLNRRYLEERLTEELERSKRHQYPMSFVMIDIDDFKHYNDLNGHQAGDIALEMTAQCLKSALRAADVAARYGGEEFSILLPQTGLSEAHEIAERIRRRIERTAYHHGNSQPLGAVTVSIGISAYGQTLNTPAEVIGAADRALYMAKKMGKNRVQIYSPASFTSSFETGAK